VTGIKNVPKQILFVFVLELELVSKELNHFGVSWGLLRAL